MNFRALILYFFKNFLASLHSAWIFVFFWGPSRHQTPCLQIKITCKLKKRTNLSNFPNSFTLKYYIVCFPRQTSIRYVGKISEKNSWPPPWPNPGSATDFDWQDGCLIRYHGHITSYKLIRLALINTYCEDSALEWTPDASPTWFLMGNLPLSRRLCYSAIEIGWRTLHFHSTVIWQHGIPR